MKAALFTSAYPGNFMTYSMEIRMNYLNAQIEQATTLIKQARQIVAMTGAGISTPSGIPDFRSPDSGLWDRVDPLAVASIMAFRQNPDNFYNWIHPLASKLLDALPNPAHYALAALEAEGKLQAIITQNIDDLHAKAGSKTVYELHGNLREATCTQCYKIKDSLAIFRKFADNGQTPRCECGGVLKPNVIRSSPIGPGQWSQTDYGQLPAHLPRPRCRRRHPRRCGRSAATSDGVGDRLNVSLDRSKFEE
jgi:NAD-dependent deacetylase